MRHDGEKKWDRCFSSYIDSDNTKLNSDLNNQKEETRHTHKLHRHVPVIVDTPEARKDVPEAGVAVKFGLALGAFYRALQSPA